MTKLDKDLKRVTKRLAIKASSIGAINLVEQVDDEPIVNLEILNQLIEDCIDNFENELSNEYILLINYIKQALKGYTLGQISKKLLTKPFKLS